MRFLQVSARLLLEYNVRSQSLERRIEQVARYLGVDLKTVVGYRQVTLVLADGRSLQARASELRIIVAISADAASLFAPPFAAGLIGAVLVCFANVVLRYGFGISFIWMQDTYVWLNAAAFTLGAAFALMADAHVRVDVFYRPAAPRNRKSSSSR